MTAHTYNGIAVEEGSGNVYADLGMADADAMLAKANLVTQLLEGIQQRGCSQDAAAQALGLSGEQLEALLLGRFRSVSEATLRGYLVRLGNDGAP